MASVALVKVNQNLIKGLSVADKSSKWQISLDFLAPLVNVIWQSKSLNTFFNYGFYFSQSKGLLPCPKYEIILLFMLASIKQCGIYKQFFAAYKATQRYLCYRIG
jgi:hypothetical protein